MPKSKVTVKSVITKDEENMKESIRDNCISNLLDGVGMDVVDSYMYDA